MIRLVALLVLLPVCFVGCGGGETDNSVQVSGRVTFDDQPLESGLIQFVPSDGKGSPASLEIKNGDYSGAVGLGSKQVMITSPKVTGKRKLYDTPDSPEVEITEERIPLKYNGTTTLSASVTREAVKFDFPLKSKP